MSIVTLKKKTGAVYSKNHSKRGPDIFWGGVSSSSNSGVGFSINGPLRNVGYVGQDMKYSKAVTPFNGVYAKGHGGHFGKYDADTSHAIYNVTDTSTLVKGGQLAFNKPSVISTYGMLRNKYRWAYNGKYPNYWVQPDANMPYNKSQGAYVSQLGSANDCVNDTNDSGKYVDNVTDFNRERKGRLDCANNYSKSLHKPIDSSLQTARIQQKCANPTLAQMPFPPAVNNSGCNSGS